MLLFINNSSPAFVLSSIGIGMFSNIKIGVILLISHVLASIVTGKILSYKYKFKKNIKDINLEENNMYNYSISFEIITKSIVKSLYTMCMIFGFMVIFILAYNYILKILSYIININSYISSMILCSMEITSGIKKFINLPLNLKISMPLISLFLGFGSFSIIFQIFSCVYKNNFKLKKILKGKLWHGIISSIITYILINIPLIYEHMNIYTNTNYNIQNFNYIKPFTSTLSISLIILVFCITFIFILKKKRCKKSSLLKGG